MPAVSIRDVAERARVSVGTVSNVLNRADKVSAAVVERVHAAIAELGYVRNDAARQLRAGRSTTIGLVVLDVRNPFFTDVARGAEDAAAANGLSILLGNSDEDSAREATYLDLFEEQRVHGVLISPFGDVGAAARAGSAHAAPPPCWSTASAATARSARCRSTTSPAAGSPPSTCSSRAPPPRVRGRAVRDPAGLRPA